MKFVSLHTHTTFSFGDGHGPVRTHVERVKELGMSAIAVTDHGNVSSHAQLERACKDLGVKPIFGCEIYEAPTDPKTGELKKTRKKYHQTIMARDQEGLRNLYRTVSRSWQSFYAWPTTSAKSLKRHSSGLIILSGCSDSLLSCTLLGGKESGPKREEVDSESFERARRIVEWYQDFSGGDYYIECQRFPGLERICKLNEAFEELSEVTGAKIVATTDVHYPMIADRKMQKILHMAHRGGTIEDAETGDWNYEAADLTYPLSDQEIYKDLRATGLSKSVAKEAILETERIADRCNVELPKNTPIRYPVSEADWKPWTTPKTKRVDMGRYHAH